ncbi:hypothetical protein SteCoe_29798 [Stentor coeruleus]|uniref:MORN repeat protein n=1 Tax=Stentor coeruleus TaxID=5963 RepID=A0A1R2B519_9CILI|nr:hypothetical protein SteCoe_29798 [Stentor coeruleus]
MGNCPCACKKTEPGSEIVTEAEQIKNLVENQQEISTLNSHLHIVEASLNIEESKELPQESLVKLSHIQGLFRGYLVRMQYIDQICLSEMDPAIQFEHPELEIPETDTQAPHVDFQVDFTQLPGGFLSESALEKYNFYGKFDFGEPDGKEFKNLGKLIDGSYYQGEVDEFGIPCGKGSIFYEDGSMYEGAWKAGKFYGYGRMISQEGDVFEGDFIEGQLTGKGKKIYANGNSYVGELVNSFPHGFGEEIMSDKSAYKGNFINGLKSGKGNYTWPEGSSYEGMFVEDKIEGFGKYIWPDKEYEGEWKDNIQHGQGCFKWNDGKKYAGGYVMGKKQGYGIFEWPDGKKYEGNWFDGKQEGEGTFSKNGVVRQQGIWKDGKFMGKKEDQSS